MQIYRDLLWQLSIIYIFRERVTPSLYTDKLAGRLTGVIINNMYYVTLSGLYSLTWKRYHKECLHDKPLKVAYVAFIGFVNDQTCQLLRGLLIYCREIDKHAVIFLIIICSIHG